MIHCPACQADQPTIKGKNIDRKARTERITYLCSRCPATWTMIAPLNPITEENVDRQALLRMIASYGLRRTVHMLADLAEVQGWTIDAVVLAGGAQHLEH